MKFIFFVTVALILYPIDSLIAGTVTVNPGLYEVRVQVLLPHIDKAVIQERKRFCVTREMSRQRDVFRIMSGSPLVRCARIPDISSGFYKGFRVECAGRRSASAVGEFEYSPDQFSGHIEMNMGGKNMRIIERQTAKRVGPCLQRQKELQH